MAWNEARIWLAAPGYAPVVDPIGREHGSMRVLSFVPKTGTGSRIVATGVMRHLASVGFREVDEQTLQQCSVSTVGFLTGVCRARFRKPGENRLLRRRSQPDAEG